MFHQQLQPETLEHALAQTEQNDERDEDFWLPLVLEHGYAVHFGDEHGIGRQLPYAMTVIDVQHVRGNDYFSGPVNDTGAALEHLVIVFADELHTTSKGLPSNRQSDGNTYVYKLYSLEHHVSDNLTDFAALPSGDYKLEILVPLFKVEPIISIYGGTIPSKAYRVSTSGYVYDSGELEAGNGFMGVIAGPDLTVAPRGSVWKLLNKPTNVTQAFRNEMCRRQWAFNEASEASQMQEAGDFDNIKVKLEVSENDLDDLVEGAAAVTLGSKRHRQRDDQEEMRAYGREAKRLRF